MPKPLLATPKRFRCAFKIKDKEHELLQFIKDEIHTTHKPFDLSNAFLSGKFGCSIKSISMMLSSLNKQGKVRIYIGAIKGKNNPLTWRVIQIVNKVVEGPAVIAVQQKAQAPNMSKKIMFQGKEIKLSQESIDRAFLGKVDKKVPQVKVVEPATPELFVAPTYLNRFKTIDFDIKDLKNGNFPVGLDLNNHPVVKDLLKSSETPYWNKWKEECAGYAPRQQSTLTAVLSILDRMKEIIVSRYGNDYSYDSKELAERISNKIIEFYGAK